MKRFKNILVVASTRGVSEPMDEVVGALGVRNDASVRLVDVVQPFPVYARMLGPDVDALELEEGLTRTRHEALERAASRLRDRGLRATTTVLRGTAFVEILREVHRGGHDLLVKTAGKEGGISSLIFGSLDMHLLRKCPCPVWLLKPGTDPVFRRVLAAVDVGAEAEEGRSLNRLILELSTSLAAASGGEVHVAHCWTVPGAGLLERRMSAEDYRVYRSEVKARVTALFQKLVSDFTNQIPTGHRHLLEGEADTTLAGLAREERIDLMVMGTVARSGIPGLLIGNTAENLIRQVDCALLTAKPENFVSPVSLARSAGNGDEGGTT